MRVTTATWPPSTLLSMTEKTRGRSRYLGEPSGRSTACETFSPPEMDLARPRAKTIMASVAMKGCILKREMSSPDTSPQAPAASSTARMAGRADQARWMLSWANRTALKPSRLPTERSMPPVMMTRVRPQARIP